MRVPRVIVGALVIGGMVGQAAAREGGFRFDDGAPTLDKHELSREEVRRYEDETVRMDRNVVRRRAARYRPYLSGGSLALDLAAREVWVADSDNGVVAISDERGERVLRVVAVGEGPEQVVVGPDGRGFVTVRDAGEVAIIEPRATTVKARVRLGGEPYGLALSADGRTLYVSLAHAGAVVALDAASLAEKFRLAVDADPRGLAATPEGDKLFVAHLTGRAVSVIDLGEAALGRGAAAIRRIWLPGGERDELGELAGSTGRAPNLSFAIAMSPSGHRLYVPHVLEDTGAGVAPEVRSQGYGAGTFDPIVATVTAIDAEAEELMEPGAEVASLSSPLRGFSQPRAAAVDPIYSRLFVAGLGSDDVRVMSTLMTTPLRSPVLPKISLGAGAGPKGLAVSPDGKRLYVHAAFKHELVVVDVAEPRGWAQPKLVRLRVGEERWPQAAVHGRQIFFSNRDPRVSASQQFACGSCHPEGKQDGMTWRLDKGPRQTPVLAGRLVGTAPYNWLGTRGSLKDNMKETMGRLGGSGLPKKDLDDLELFITHYLDPGPLQPALAYGQGPGRAAAELSSLQAHGKALFESDEVGCANCHAPGALFTDGKNHDVGTTSGEELQRLLADRGEKIARKPKIDLTQVVRVALGGLATTQLLRALGGRPLAVTPGSEAVVMALAQQVFLGGAPDLDPTVNVESRLFRVAGARPKAEPRKRGKLPQPTRLAYNTPSLVGVGATAPYFHDGSARDLREVLTTGNPGDRMGRTSHLKPQDIDALVAYLETL